MAVISSKTLNPSAEDCGKGTYICVEVRAECKHALLSYEGEIKGL
jgi:hypothetical protein